MLSVVGAPPSSRTLREGGRQGRGERMGVGPFAEDQPRSNHGRSLSASYPSQKPRTMGHTRSGGLLENQRSESRGERVSQRDAESCGSGRTELLIIVD